MKNQLLSILMKNFRTKIRYSLSGQKVRKKKDRLRVIGRVKEKNNELEI